MKAGKVTFVLVSFVLMVGSGVMATTIYETFDVDPTLGGGWTSSVQGSSVFAYNSTGYLDVEYVRDPVNVDRYTTTLDATYDKTQEYWFDMDIQMDSTSYFGAKTASAGLYNSSNDNATNSMVAEFSQNKTSSSQVRRVDWHLFKSDGSNRSKTVADETAADAYLRFMIHYWSEDGQIGQFTMDVYDIPTGTLVDSYFNDDIIIATESVSYDLFGLGNLTASTKSGNMRAKIDNLYFSTEGANATLADTSFIVPEPASICILGLGGLLAAYRRRKESN